MLKIIFSLATIFLISSISHADQKVDTGVNDCVSELNLMLVKADVFDISTETLQRELTRAITAENKNDVLNVELVQDSSGSNPAILGIIPSFFLTQLARPKLQLFMTGFFGPNSSETPILKKQWIFKGNLTYNNKTSSLSNHMLIAVKRYQLAALLNGMYESLIHPQKGPRVFKIDLLNI